MADWAATDYQIRHPGLRIQTLTLAVYTQACYLSSRRNSCLGCQMEIKLSFPHVKVTVKIEEDRRHSTE